MNTMRYFVAAVAAGVWILMYGFVMNGMVLAEFWSSNEAPGLMRAEGEEILWAIVASCLLQGFALAFIFTRGYEARGIGEGLRFGALIAWFVAAVYLLFYGLQPWAMNTMLVSMAVDGVMYLGAGVVLALVYRE